MGKLGNTGHLMYLYMDYIAPINTEQFPSFLVEVTAKKMREYGDRNWQPLLVKEVGEDQYEILGNEFIYAVAKAAGLDRLWCIIADNKPETEQSIKFLTQAEEPKINLCSASKEEIQLALQYVRNLPQSPLKGMKIEVAATKIASAPRRDKWESFNEVAQLKCGITKGSKLESLKQVFLLLPQSDVETVVEVNHLSPQSPSSQSAEGEQETQINFKSKTVTELKAIAKQRGIKGYTKLTKADLLKKLNQKPLEDFLEE